MKRQRVIQEIISTEETYLQSLELLYQSVVLPLLSPLPQIIDPLGHRDRQTASNDQINTHIRNSSLSALQRISSFTGFAKTMEIYITPNEHSLAFSNIREIIDLSQALLLDLKQDGAQPANVILKYGHQLQHVYEMYVGNYETNMITIAELERRPGFTDYITQQLNGKQLGGLAIQPVQRVPRYLLLLKELSKHCNDENDEHELQTIKKAIANLQNVCKFINAAKSHLLQIQIVLDIEKECGLSGLVKPRRCLLMKGILLKVCRRANKPFMFWLFNDMIMYGTQKLLGYVVSHQFNLERVQIRDVDYTDRTTLPVTIVPALEFRSPKKSFILLCTNEKLKSAWMIYFQKSKANVVIRSESQRKSSVMGKTKMTRSGHVAPLWVQDVASNNCQKCGDLFTLFHRRHHCRHCGALVCNDCSFNRAHIPSKTKSVRVCEDCFNILKGGSGVVSIPNDGTTEVLNPFMNNQIIEKDEGDLIVIMEEEIVEEVEPTPMQPINTTVTTDIPDTTQPDDGPPTSPSKRSSPPPPSQFFQKYMEQVSTQNKDTKETTMQDTWVSKPRKKNKKKGRGSKMSKKKGRGSKMSIINKSCSDKEFVHLLTRRRRGSSKFMNFKVTNSLEDTV